MPRRPALRLRTKRIYEPRAPEDGVRILIMRLWPRGIKKTHIDEWNRDLAPSRELVFAFKRQGLAWAEYVPRFWSEIRPAAIAALRVRARRETVTLLCACADETHCHRTLIRDAAQRGLSRPRPVRRRTDA
ncbi:MAG: DUF488 family protein [Planctomycetes bacterium]|nr:DUF488 family protein [Planctomycetota bacterium]